MDPTRWLIIGLTLFMVLFTLIFERSALIAQRDQHDHRGIYFRAGCFKALSSLGFVLLYGWSVSAGGSSCAQATWLLIALLASAVGDLALIGQRDVFFLTGLSAFFCAHLAYATSVLIPMMNSTGAESLGGQLGITLLFTGSASLYAFRAFLPEIPPQLRAPSAAYAAVIAVMVASCFVRAYERSCVWLGLASLAFWISDLAVARQRFHGPRLPLGGFSVRRWGLPLYYVAQLIFALEASPH